jgi:hypothetical protein
MRSRHLLGLTARPFDRRTVTVRMLSAVGLTALALLLAACRDDPIGPGVEPTPQLNAAAAEDGTDKYKFLPIVDTRTDPFNPFGFGCPAINNVGEVAFRVRLQSGATGVFRSDGRALVTIVEDNFERFGFIGFHPSINDQGDVSFAANVRPRGEAILRGRGGPLTTIAQTEPGPFNFFGFDTSVDGQGNVAFKAELDNFDEGLFFGAGGPITTVYLASTSPFRGTDVGPASNEVGQIAFHEDLDEGGSGIFLWTAGTFTTIATTAGPIGAFFRPPSLSDEGVVAFHALLDGGAGEAILKGSGGPLTTVADTDGPFSSFGFNGPSVNSQGLVAFSASLDTGEQGLFIGPDPVRDRVIGTGDKFRGGAVTSLTFCREGLNNGGQLVFSAQLDDGRSVILRATPRD